VAQTWTGWECDVLKALGAPCSSQNVKFLDSWQNQESSGSQHGGFNPLNVGYLPGYSYWTSSNGTPIAEFPNAQVGAAQTAARLRSISPSIVAALQGGNILDKIKTAGSMIVSDLTYWLTGKRSGDTTYAQRVISGTGTATSQGGPSGGSGGTGSAVAGAICKVECCWLPIVGEVCGFSPLCISCKAAAGAAGVPGQGTAGSVGSGIAGALGSAGSILDFLKALTDPAFWLRIGEVIAGALVTLAGLIIIMRHIGLTPPSVPVPVPSA
jgi:hypothetical protein